MSLEGEREVPIPYYLQVAETLKSRIVAGRYAPADHIPSYRELEVEFNVSSTTVRRAVEFLVQEGIVKRKWGVGTAVCARSEDSLCFEMVGDFQALRFPANRLPLSTEVLELDLVVGPDRFREVLGADPDETLWRMRKIRRHGEVVVAYYVTYSRPEWCGTITKEEAEAHRFTDVFRRRSGLKLERLEQRIGATTADLDSSAQLKLGFGAPILLVDNSYYDGEGRILAITQIYYRGDKSSYKISVAL